MIIPFSWHENLTAVAIDPGDDSSQIPAEPSLYQNYPNPFNPVTQLEFDIPKSTQVVLSIYDITRQKVAGILNEQMLPGRHKVTFRAGSLPSAIYFYRIRIGDFKAVKQMVFIAIRTYVFSAIIPLFNRERIIR